MCTDLEADLDLIAFELRLAMRDYFVLLSKPRLRKEYFIMALDFTKLNAAVELAQANAAALQAQAENTSEAADQASIDSAASDLESANAITSGLLPKSSADSLAFTTTSLPSATVGAAYSEIVATSGGTAPVTITATGLPSWATSSDGAVTGTPTASETASVVFTATDSASPPVSVETTLSLTAA